MAKGDIKLSPKFGVNPSMAVCFYCGQEKGDIVLPGRIRRKGTQEDVEAPRRAVWDDEPCAGCRAMMKQGIMMCEVDEARTTDINNPHRTGCMVVITDEAAERIFEGEFRDRILKTRFCFVPTDVWDRLGIPRENIDNRDQS